MLRIHTGRMLPIIDKDLRSLEKLQRFWLVLSKQPNQTFDRNIESPSEIKIILKLNVPNQFEFILDYKEFSFLFEDLK